MRVLIVAAALALGGCASDRGISNSIEFCCGAPGNAPTTYSLSLFDVPAFLSTPLRDGLVAALSAHGMREASANPDALVTLRFTAVYPHSDPLANDGFVDALSVGGPRKFDARVTLDIRRAADGAELLRGTLQREHTESVGSYDHERARPAIRAAFEQLLKRLPRT